MSKASSDKSGCLGLVLQLFGIEPSNREVAYFFPLAFLLAAQRAFISWESLFRPAAVRPPFIRAALPPVVLFFFAHRAFIAAAIFALA